jgi:hypothetical protein
VTEKSAPACDLGGGHGEPRRRGLRGFAGHQLEVQGGAVARAGDGARERLAQQRRTRVRGEAPEVRDAAGAHQGGARERRSEENARAVASSPQVRGCSNEAAEAAGERDDTAGARLER